MGGAALGKYRKTKAKEVEVKEIAYDLLKLYAKREMSTGIAFEPDTTYGSMKWKMLLNLLKPPDQMKVYREGCKNDMEAGAPDG